MAAGAMKASAWWLDRSSATPAASSTEALFIIWMRPTHPFVEQSKFDGPGAARGSFSSSAADDLSSGSAIPRPVLIIGQRDPTACSHRSSGAAIDGS